MMRDGSGGLDRDSLTGRFLQEAVAELDITGSDKSPETATTGQLGATIQLLIDHPEAPAFLLPVPQIKPELFARLLDRRWLAVKDRRDHERVRMEAMQLKFVALIHRHQE